MKRAEGQAASRLLRVEIVDVCRNIFSGPCRRVVAPAADGEVGILPRHTPFLTQLRPGEIRLQTESGEEQYFYLSGGYMEVQHWEVSILADQVLRSEEIDREAALEAKRGAERVLRENRIPSERDRAYLELLKALAQLRLLERLSAQKLGRTRP
ncbi:F0F1 ATP synthase subunit epsilon [Methylococcus geothermalis]|uniref:ATP synthase epsilon chain n=1 Tax=Methylococcus geothermalis TaxID=2681310 RepID=A0A858Q5H5_9GAMM|nr:F0F1 ATP synthase subunit epsilon [Methylococcus geothermalis]QJD29054.1 F0F1 ATP synthase subunit epsilon [Methylococcus geothermalis]